MSHSHSINEPELQKPLTFWQQFFLPFTTDREDQRASSFSWEAYYNRRFNEIYPLDGLDKITNTFNGISIEKSMIHVSVIVRELEDTFQGQILQTLMVEATSTNGAKWKAFLGLPTYLAPRDAKNCKWWTSFVRSPLKTAAYVVLFPLTLLRVAWNVVKLLELLPALGEAYFYDKAAKLYKIDPILNTKKVNNYLIIGTLFKIVRLAIRTITSPFNSMKAAIQTRKEIGGIKGLLISAALFTLSTAMTTVAYAFAAPAAISSVITPIFQYIGSILGPVSTALNWLVAKAMAVATWMTSAPPAINIGATATAVTAAKLTMDVVHIAENAKRIRSDYSSYLKEDATKTSPNQAKKTDQKANKKSTPSSTKKIHQNITIHVTPPTAQSLPSELKSSTETCSASPSGRRSPTITQEKTSECESNLLPPSPRPPR